MMINESKLSWTNFFLINWYSTRTEAKHPAAKKLKVCLLKSFYAFILHQ